MMNPGTVSLGTALVHKEVLKWTFSWYSEYQRGLQHDCRKPISQVVLSEVGRGATDQVLVSRAWQIMANSINFIVNAESLWTYARTKWLLQSSQKNTNVVGHRRRAVEEVSDLRTYFEEEFFADKEWGLTAKDSGWVRAGTEWCLPRWRRNARHAVEVGAGWWKPEQALRITFGRMWNTHSRLGRQKCICP